MLVDAMSFVLGRINQYIHQVDGNPAGTEDVVIIGNISQMENIAVSSDLENKVVLSLVNMSEESALRNTKNVTTNQSGSVDYQSPPLFLNLSLLFTATHNNYTTALRRLTQVLTFFQTERTFRLSENPGTSDNLNNLSDIVLHMDLLSLSYEEVNYLWGSLGGKQLPFAMYRGRLVEIQEQRPTDVGGRIEQINVRGRGKAL
jgi:hypothetical protein